MAPPTAETASEGRAASPLARLRWRCRRGMKELDLLLERWLETRYLGVSSAEQAAFRQFLELPDPDIARYLLGHEQPAEAERRTLVAAIRGVRDGGAGA
jgi:antitoxin CptB